MQRRVEAKGANQKFTEKLNWFAPKQSEIQTRILLRLTHSLVQ